MDRGGAERNQIWITAYEAEVTPILHHCKDIACEQRSFAVRACRPYYGGYPYYGSSYYGGYPYGSYGYGYSAYGYSGNYYYGSSYPYYSNRTVYRGYNGSVVARVQERLARAGYYRGPIDGLMGPRTRYAIRVYERTHGLPADGVIDRRLLATMGIA